MLTPVPLWLPLFTVVLVHGWYMDTSMLAVALCDTSTGFEDLDSGRTLSKADNSDVYDGSPRLPTRRLHPGHRRHLAARTERRICERFSRTICAFCRGRREYSGVRNSERAFRLVRVSHRDRRSTDLRESDHGATP